MKFGGQLKIWSRNHTNGNFVCIGTSSVSKGHADRGKNFILRFYQKISLFGEKEEVLYRHFFVTK